MEWFRDWWGLIVVLVGWMMASLSYLFAHSKKHQQIEDALCSGRDSFRRNEADLADFRDDLKETHEKVQEIAVSVARIEGLLRRLGRNGKEML